MIKTRKQPAEIVSVFGWGESGGGRNLMRSQNPGYSVGISKMGERFMSAPKMLRHFKNRRDAQLFRDGVRAGINYSREGA